MWYYRRLPDGLIVMHTRPEHAPALEELQRLCFPTLADAERFKAAHYRKHLEVFPEGQFVALDGDRIVGATTTLRRHFDVNHIDHRFADIIQGGWLTSHEPGGDWLYGADVGVDPVYRGRGLGKALYAARQEVVWRFDLRGQVIAGMISGYGDVKDRVTVEDYYAGVVAGRITDPTLSMQLKLGFAPRGLVANYVNDPICDNYGVLLVLDADQDVPGASRKHAKSYIRLNTEIPGPRARDLIARRVAAVPAGLGRATDVVVERAHGELIFDVDGNTLIDLAGGLGMLAVGHTPPAVVNAIAKQAEKYVHVCSLVTTYEPYVRLAELLNEITPGTFAKKTILANSGAEAVEYSIKLARKFSGRPAIICFEGGYHGRTLLTLSLTSKYGLFKSGFGPFAPEIVRLPIPHVYRTPAGMTEEQYVDFGIRQLEHALVAQVDPSAVAAMIVEPVQGEAGFIPLPARFLQRIRELCDQHRHRHDRGRSAMRVRTDRPSLRRRALRRRAGHDRHGEVTRRGDADCRRDRTRGDHGFRAPRRRRRHLRRQPRGVRRGDRGGRDDQAAGISRPRAAPGRRHARGAERVEGVVSGRRRRAGTRPHDARRAREEPRHEGACLAGRYVAGGSPGRVQRRRRDSRGAL